ncbi:MAG: efflux RND transporter periplasmic adaptor subunit [Desulfobacteraceae bacterium]|jgi:HlyD family secretion protein
MNNIPDKEETTMDQPIDPVYRRNLLIKRVVVSLVLISAFIFFAGWGIDVIRPSVKRIRIRTAVAEIGDVTETIRANGAIIPEFEQVLTSPMTTTVVSILKQPGDILRPGDALLVLDIRDMKLERDKLHEQILIQRNLKEKIEVDLSVDLNELESRLQREKLQMKLVKARYEAHKELLELGIVSKEKMQEVELEVDIARIEVKRLERSLENAAKLSRNRMGTLDLEISMLEKEYTNIKRQIVLAETRADREGVLTWIVPEAGAALKQGEVFARIADLSSYRLKATISDIHTARLKVGMQVIISINEETDLTGTVGSILPKIENGIITFMVDIDDKAHSLLRPNLQVDIYIVTSKKRNVTRIEKGPFAQGHGIHDVFVIRGDRAVRTEATFGITSHEYYEIVDGIAEGEEVIISDMTDHKNAEEVMIK